MNFAPLHGIDLRESTLAVKSVPKKLHNKRSNQSEAYHLRVQKKWLKRHGTTTVPASYVIDLSFIGGQGKALVCHPIIAAKIRAALVKAP